MAPQSKTGSSRYKRNKPLGFLGVVISAAMLACALPFLSKGGDRGFVGTSVLSVGKELSAQAALIKSKALTEVFEMPKVYTLQWNTDPVPVPNPECFEGENYYKDETIEVKVWDERIANSDVHFAEVWIQHPTQIRSAWAGRIVGSGKVANPVRIADDINALIAINCDYAGYRTTGYIIRQNQVYRPGPYGYLDTLLIDSNGDFHLMPDYQVEKSGILDEYQITNSYSFGPSLILDGEPVKDLSRTACEEEKWNILCPRTAIGQLGPLHYLLCVVDGELPGTPGVTIYRMREIMMEKGCIQAYNFDGSASSTMIFGGRTVNAPMWGANVQRSMYDILYFATAVPDHEIGN